MPITRTPMVDDDGSGTTGTVINNAWLTNFYNAIDAALAPLGGGAPQTVGAYTPADASGAGLSMVTALGFWVKTGVQVLIAAQVTLPVTGNTNAVMISLPFPVDGQWALSLAYHDFGTTAQPYLIRALTSAIHFGAPPAYGTVTYASLSGKTFIVTGTYRAPS